uniref:ATP synthase complex subunit 8 n=1 Tax=Lonchoptera multiseta TaxID=2321081 RepID=A0A5H2PFV9_9MUSC|nr:ATP synthase F0 subunit 8 [Lonchoptera multiseta]
MPQMAPLSWLILFIFFTIMFIFFNIMNYYNFNTSKKSKENMMMSKSISFNWKW